jgi:hypothetical protein
VANAQVNWYGDKVLLIVQKATKAVLWKLALQGEKMAKENVQANNQIDTGFMLNTIYSEGPGMPPSDVWESGVYTDKSGNAVERRGGTPTLVSPEHAAVGCVAEYAIYQEMQNSFLYRAMEQLVDETDRIVVTVKL